MDDTWETFLREVSGAIKTKPCEDVLLRSVNIWTEMSKKYPDICLCKFYWKLNPNNCIYILGFKVDII